MSSAACGPLRGRSDHQPLYHLHERSSNHTSNTSAVTTGYCARSILMGMECGAPFNSFCRDTLRGSTRHADELCRGPDLVVYRLRWNLPTFEYRGKPTFVAARARCLGPPLNHAAESRNLVAMSLLVCAAFRGARQTTARQRHVARYATVPYSGNRSGESFSNGNCGFGNCGELSCSIHLPRIRSWKRRTCRRRKRLPGN